jgi:hypothetical protein
MKKYKRKIYSKRDGPLPSERPFSYEQCFKMNRAFAKAMLRARKRGNVSFQIGVIINDAPLVPAIISVPPRYSYMGSAAADCADEVRPGT